MTALRRGACARASCLRTAARPGRRPSPRPMRRCDCWPAIRGSTPAGSPSSGFLLRWRGRASRGLRTAARRAGAERHPVCRPCRLLPGGCLWAAARQGPTRRPVLMLLGEKDDNLPIAKAKTISLTPKGAGPAPPIDVSIYPGAYHAWTVPSLGAPRFYPQYASTRKCPYFLLGRRGPLRLIGGQERPMDLTLADLSEGRPGLHHGLR